VLSELGYYLEPDSLRSLARRVRAGLTPTGTVLACHWRHPIAGCRLDGDQVHAALGEQLGLHHLCGLVEPDLRIDVWCAEPASVAAREGLV
jgi:hypothetical protein